jgi:hypothetical protein
MTAYDRILRLRLRSATARLARVDGELIRPPDGTAIGEVGGFYYEKRGGVFSAALPGQMIDQPDGRYLMALYPDQLPDGRAGDELTLPNVRCRLLSTIDRGAYQTYRLEEIP